MYSGFGRSVPVSLVLRFDIASKDEIAFRREYDTLSELDEDPVGHWLKIARARGETKDSDKVVLNLLVELHRKVDALSKVIKQENREYLELGKKTFVDGMGHGYFLCEGEQLDPGEKYYGRIEMPIFPERIVPFYFTAIDKKGGKITVMHERDIKDWDGYIAARERALIRERRGL